MKTKVALVDDNSFLINPLKEKLSFFEDIKVKFVAYNGTELITKLEKDHNVDLVLMDIEMPVLNGIETTEIVKQKYPHIKIVMLTVFDDNDNVFKAIKAGADGYLLKDVKAETLYKGIKDTLNGGAAMNPSIALKTLRLLRNPVELSPKNEEVPKLSKREIEVLEQLSKGLGYDVIAHNLFLSTGTVRKHIENIYRKLQVHNKLQAVEKARRNQLI